VRKLHTWRLLVLLCVLALLIAFAIPLARHSRRRIVTLPNGVTIEFLGVTVGTNRLPHGFLLQRILANHIPPQGLKLGPWYIPSPVFLNGFYEADAHAWLLVSGPNIQGLHFYWDGSEVVTSNRFGRQLSIPTAQPFSPNTNGSVLHIPLVAFPRDDRTAIVRFSPPAEKAEPRTWLEFEFSNPFFKSSPPPPAKIPPFPPLNRFNGEDFILSSASDHHVIFTLPSKQWQIPYCRLSDLEGNSALSSRTEGPRDDGTVRVWFDHTLETNRPWRVEATFVHGDSIYEPTTDFPPEQLRTAHITPTQPASLTNLSGENFTISLGRYNQLMIQSPNRAGLPCWAILSATNENNQPVNLSNGFNWTYNQPGSGSLIQISSLPSSASTLDLKLACPPSFTAEFFVVPQP
jgi:hypothetical protein